MELVIEPVAGEEEEPEEEQLDRTWMMPRMPVPPAPPVEDRGGDGTVEDGDPAVPPEPPQRPPVPFTEEQAEMNSRMQLYQDDLLNAFPQMTREDIVLSEGNLVRLAAIIAPKSGMAEANVRGRLEEILHATPAEATNPDTLDSREVWPETTKLVDKKPEEGDQHPSA
jgi:hypothetical protein